MANNNPIQSGSGTEARQGWQTPGRCKKLKLDAGPDTPGLQLLSSLAQLGRTMGSGGSKPETASRADPRTTAGPRPVHGQCILRQSPGPPWLPAHPPHSSQFSTLSSLCPCSSDIPTQTLGATQHNMGSSSSKQKASSQDDSAKTTASPTPAHPPAAPETATALEAPAATVHAKPSLSHPSRGPETATTGSIRTTRETAW